MHNLATTTSLPDFTVAELATALNIHSMTVHRLVKSGAIKSYLIGRARRIPHTELARIRTEGVPSSR
jgi:excisionase family DNA binding protein